MTPEQFRQHGHQVIDWIAQYMEEVEHYPVMSRVVPGEIRGKLPAAPPEHGEPFDALLRDVNDIIMPGITHWQSPNFFAFFPANHSGPSILGDLLSSGLGVQGMLWATSPACTELETHVLDWLVDMLGLPAQFHSSSAGGGVIQDAASSASLCALLAARERRSQYATNARGVSQRTTAYTSIASPFLDREGHDGRRVGTREPADDRRRWVVCHASRPIGGGDRAGRTQGAQPCCVVASVGTTSSGGVDPLPAIGEICRRHGLWMHVDAAMYGTAGLCPEYRGMFQGLELADSYCFNPHKWMFVNFDCDCFYVSDRAALIRTLSVLPEYLKNKATASGAVIDYRDWHVPLGRRFRSLKLWFVIRHYGVEGLRAKVREHVAMAQQFARWVDEHPSFERVAPTPLNLVAFRHVAGDAASQQILDRINQSGRVYLTHTKLDNRLVIRMSIGQTNTRLEHVQNAWALICEAAEELAPG